MIDKDFKSSGDNYLSPDVQNLVNTALSKGAVGSVKVISVSDVGGNIGVASELVLIIKSNSAYGDYLDR